MNPVSALDDKLRSLLNVVKDLKRENAIMAIQLEEARSRLAWQADELGHWERERQVVRDRIECVLNELELINVSSKEAC